MANIRMSEFYKGYRPEQIEMIKKIIEDAFKDMNESNMVNVANKLSDTKYNKYPEIQYYRVNLLIRIGKINKAYKVACNYHKFQPLDVISKELEAKIESLEPKRVNMINIMVSKFLAFIPELSESEIYDEIKDLLYEEVVELDQLLDSISKISSPKELVDLLKSGEANRYPLLQYIRIKTMLQVGNKQKAQNLLTGLNRPIFQKLVNGKYKEIKKEIKEPQPVEQPIVVEEPKVEESKEVIEEPKEEVDSEYLKVLENLEILLTKLYVDNITIEEIEESNIDELAKVYFKLAYYEKYNRKKGEIYLKEQIKHFKKLDRPDILKKLHNLTERFTGKVRLYDIGLYQRLIGVRIRFKEMDMYRKKEEPTIQPSKIVPVSEPPKAIEQPKEEIKTVVPEPIKPKYITNSSVTIMSKSIGKTSSPKLEKKVKPKTIKELLYDDIIEVERVIYLELQKPDRQAKATKAWDILESMVSKPANDQEALNRVICFLSRVDKENLPSYMGGISFPVNYTKHMK